MSAVNGLTEIEEEVKRVNDQLREVQAEGIELPRGARIPPGKIDEALARDGLSVLDESDGPASPVRLRKAVNAVNDLKRVATAFHDEYEAQAQEKGWETNEATRTSFAELPEANRLTMLATVKALIDRGIIALPASPVLGDEERLPDRVEAGRCMACGRLLDNEGVWCKDCGENADREDWNPGV